MTTTMNACDVDLAETCLRLVPEVPADVTALIGKPVNLTAGSMAFHGWLDAVEGDDAPVLVLRASAWTRRIPLSSVRRIVESNRIPGSANSHPVPARRTVVGPARTCCRCRRSVGTYATESVRLSWGGSRKFHTCPACLVREAGR